MDKHLIRFHRQLDEEERRLNKPIPNPVEDFARFVARKWQESVTPRVRRFFGFDKGAPKP